jgi:hypothetical protein
MLKKKKSIKKLDFTTVIVAVAPLRKSPNHRVEMVGQLLFGESVQILADNNTGWVKVKSLYDNYIGWVTSSMLNEKNTLKKPRTARYITGMPIQLLKWRGGTFTLSAGSSLPGYDLLAKKILGDKAKLTGKIIDTSKQKASVSTLKKLVAPWLNTPYLWGGRTVMGVDCSGFVQVIYKMMGFLLLRDADQQATQGKTIKDLSSAKPGDLLFFNRGKKIIHVGILYAPGLVIHSSGKVRIDVLTEKGIFNAETKKQSHQLCLIKRVANFN